MTDLDEAALEAAMLSIRQGEALRIKPTKLLFQPWQLAEFLHWPISDIAAEFGVSEAEAAAMVQNGKE